MIEEVTAEAYDVPTDHPEADGTISWSSTVMVFVRVRCGTTEGIGWTYDGVPAKGVVDSVLEGVVKGSDPMAVTAINEAMVRACRNLGRPGIGACAVSAVDVACWDLKAKLLGLPLADLFGRLSDVPIYGSGGFTSYPDELTRRQLETWVADWAVPRVKIKVGESWGSEPDRDLHRVALARKVVGDGVELYVDANGAYSRKQAVRLAREMSDEHGVTWFEEPVSSDDLAGLREVSRACQADVAAGEYGYSPDYFLRMLAAEAVDCLQADVTRCGGYTGWLTAAHVALAANMQVSGHCAPNLHAHVAGSVPNLRHVEYFHDHHRIETELLDGALSPEGGSLSPRKEGIGHGLSLKVGAAERFRVA